MQHKKQNDIDPRLSYVYEYLIENNIPASAKYFHCMEECVLIIMDSPNVTFDYALKRVALKNDVPVESMRSAMKYTIKNNAQTTAKAFLYNAAAALRIAMVREADSQREKVVALSS